MRQKQLQIFDQVKMWFEKEQIIFRKVDIPLLENPMGKIPF